ncbi:hypothetical protein CLIM01_11029 [Colletotrichum limetticola]|uniref:Uncharacterized protein n=1 Tax=Colletotrichum limetticola TaxID=1209924 RepID=A0ABQ9PHT9_9PEZI|nr:hypothetical protein CLIM01_11029 [Colletotrichum limetticola]
MEFSFPLRVLRTCQAITKDEREKASSGQPLRSSRDVTFLRNLSDGSQERSSLDAIYSSHISCVVTGYDQWRWTGALLAEDWFEIPSDNPGPDAVKRYENDFDDGLLSDPLTRGRQDVYRSSWYPRSYFLHSLQVRLAQAYDEWSVLLLHVEGIINEASKKHRMLVRQTLVLVREQQPGPQQQGLLQSLDDFEDKVSDAEELLRDLEQVLGETLKSLSSFMGTDAQYFLGDEPHFTGDFLRYLAQIRQTCNALALLQLKYQGLQEKCKYMLKDGNALRKKVHT